MVKTVKIIKYFMSSKKIIFLLCIYKMVNFTKEAFENTLWLNEKHIEEKLGHKNLTAITNIYNKIYKKHRYELVDEPIKQPNRRFYLLI